MPPDPEENLRAELYSLIRFLHSKAVDIDRALSYDDLDLAIELTRTIKEKADRFFDKD